MKFFNLLILITLLILLSACNAFVKINKSDWEESNSDENEKVNIIYVVGYSRNGTDTDFLILKYDTNGNFYESRTFDGNNNDVAYGAAVDSSGNLYVTGESNNGSNYDYLTIKYNSKGNMIWQRTYNYAGDDQASGIVIDNNDYIYVTGTSDYSPNLGYTIKYDQNGNIDADVTTDEVLGGRESSYAIAIDKQRNCLYLTGFADRTSSYDYQIVKYNLDLIETWPVWYPDPSDTYNDEAYSIAIDSNGNVYVTGISSNGTDYDYFTIKYDIDGNLVTDELWPIRFNNVGNDYAEGIAIDANNNVFVTGYSRNGGGDNDFYTIKYDSYGNEQWSKIYDNGNADEAFAITIDQQGYIYVVGTSQNSSYMELLIIKYDNNGNTIWTQRYTNGDEDEARGICIVNNNIIYRNN